MQGIVIAYGPSHVTSRAAKAVRRLANPWLKVVVVAAHPGVDVSDLPTGFEVASGHGSRRVREILASLAPTEPVLVMHDDAAITSRGLRRMIDSLSPDSPVVIPFTNDVGTDHYIGTLPPPGQAEAILDQLPLPEPSQIHAFRPCVVVGYAAGLHGIAGDGYIDPFRLVHDPALPTRSTPVAASHAGTCSQVLSDPADDHRPLVVASMIVKNEEAMLDDCLASLAGTVDRIEVCDTGSTDRTVEIAERHGAVVSSFAWTGDFSEARNFVLDRCRDARLVLHIDADERLETSDPSKLRRYLATYGSEYDGFQPKISNIDSRGTVTSNFRATRIFPADGTRFDGPIHEVPMREGMTTPIHGTNLDLVALRHLGYAEEIFAQRDKGGRNIEIARTAYEAGPGFRTAYDYARSLLVDDGSSARAAELFEEALSDIEVGNPQAQAYVYGVVAANRFAGGDHHQAMTLARKGLSIVPREAGAALAFAKAALAAELPEEVLELHDWRATTPSLAPLFDVTAVEAEFMWNVAIARTRAGLLGEAYDAMAESIALNPQGIGGWHDLLPAFSAAGIDVVAAFGPMAEIESNGRIIKDSATVMPPATTAALGLDYVQRGGTDADAISIATLAAMVAGEDETALRLLEHADMLPPEMKDQLTAKAVERGLSLPVA